MRGRAAQAITLRQSSPRTVGLKNKYLPPLIHPFFQDCKPKDTFSYHVSLMACLSWEKPPASPAGSAGLWKCGLKGRARNPTACATSALQVPCRGAWSSSLEQTVLPKGGLCHTEGSAGLGWWPSWVLSFVLSPFPCPSGPGHKARALKHTDSRYLLVLVGPCLGGALTTKQGGRCWRLWIQLTLSDLSFMGTKQRLGS